MDAEPGKLPIDPGWISVNSVKKAARLHIYVKYIDIKTALKS